MFGVDVGTTKGKVALAFGSVVGVFGVYLVARQRNKNVKSMSKKFDFAPLHARVFACVCVVYVRVRACVRQIRDA